MFSTKKNVLQTVALLKAHGVKHIVVSPGSRNAPLMQTFSQEPFFQCHVIVDERNAAFYALGIIQNIKEPVAICCTSGSALLNYAPAVSEAFYQQLPLIVISADRTQEWIGQMDGQTLPQSGAFGTLVKKSVQLPEIKTETDEWFCNRLINEAILASTRNSAGPVHINIPLGEPLFDYTETQLPVVRKIVATSINKIVDIHPFVTTWNNSSKVLIVVGQMFHSPELIEELEQLAKQTNCVVFSEHISNCASDLFVSNFDAVLYTLSDEEKSEYTPDLLITLGGHIVSKRLKLFLRQNKPKNHWLINDSGDVVDLFQSLTDIIETNPTRFLNDLKSLSKPVENSFFSNLWKKASSNIKEPDNDSTFSDISVARDFLKAVPENSALHLANSSAVRNAQLYKINSTIRIYCNRGINGIESSLPTAIGFAAVDNSPVYLMIGDLSFFYTVGALWNIQHIRNLRILLINNSGGGIFHLLPGLNKSSSLTQYVAAEHSNQAKDWAKAAEIEYLPATNQNELEEHLKHFVSNSVNHSIILEVTTDMATSKQAFQEYYHNLKNK